MTNKQQKETVEQIINLDALRHRLSGLDLELLDQVIAQLRVRAGETISKSNTAELLQVSRQTVDNWIKSGTLPGVPGLNGRQQIPRQAVERAAHEVTAWRQAGRQRAATALRDIADELAPVKKKRTPAKKAAAKPKTV